MTTWTEVYGSMAGRWRPDDVAKALQSIVPDSAAILQPAARHAWYGSPHFARNGAPGFASHVINLSILERLPGLGHDVVAAIAELRKMTGLADAEIDLRDRMPTPIRREALPGMSRRQYMKRCRILAALIRKVARQAERGRFVRWTRIAKSGWALDISHDEFLSLSPDARAFVAYYVARRQRQSTFSGTGQDTGWDRVADQLFAKLAVEPWDVVAKAYPALDVLGRLGEDQRIALLVSAYSELRAMAVAMAALWDELGADPRTMVVESGMNSSDWNAVAGAWNAVRYEWLSLLTSCGRTSDLARFCPGKAMRLMAADVAAWHRVGGVDEGPDVKIFKQLPLPWDVVLGRRTCGEPEVANAAAAAGVDAGTWLAPALTRSPVATKPTHALVHGVAVSDPGLADLLRRAGWFSGKGSASVLGVAVRYDANGFAVGIAQR